MGWRLATRCPDCNAENCEEQFHRFLALEYTDMRYGAVHHLTVAAYMLQHPGRLSEDGWYAMRQTLTGFLVHGQNPAEQLSQMTRRMDSGARSWSLSKGPRKSLPSPFTWSLTITAVDASDPVQYCADIEAWARSVLTDAQKL